MRRGTRREGGLGRYPRVSLVRAKWCVKNYTPYGLRVFFGWSEMVRKKSRTLRVLRRVGNFLPTRISCSGEMVRNELRTLRVLRFLRLV